MLSFDCVEEEEREMGVERTFEALYDRTCECGNRIEITAEVWEYPEGAFNCKDVKCSGGKVVVRPKLRIVNDEQDDPTD